MTSTGTRGWHADGDLIDRYVAGALDIALSASLEAHLLRCATCRAALTSRVSPRVTARVDAAWSGVRERVEAPRLPAPVRVLRRLGLGEPSAVVLAAARSMSTAWTLATVVVLAFAALSVFVDGRLGQALYLVVAPLIPVAGVVAAFGRGADPLTEVSVATPYPPARLVLLRSLGVAATSMPLAVAVGLLLPGSAWLAFAWLVPALAFILIVLSASTWADPLVAGGVVGVGWATVVAAATRGGGPLQPVDARYQLVYLGIAALAAAVLAYRIARASSPGGIA
jgi:hypothetical protein